MTRETIQRAVGYARVSTREQAEGASIEEQTERIRAYCQARAWDLIEVIADEGCTGKNLDRLGIERALALVHKGAVDVLIVKKLDRLTRRQRDLWNLLDGELEPHDVGLVSVTESFETCSATGRAFVGMLGVFAQLERDTIAERTTDALAHKKAKGERLGATPLGYKNGGGELVENPAEQKVLRTIKRMRRQGMSLTSVAQRLNERKVPTKRGGKWYASTVRYLDQHVLARAAA